jgi:hypothetical protein
VLSRKPPLNVTLESNSGGLVLTPTTKLWSKFYYAKKLRLPLTIICDIAEYGGDSFVIEVIDDAQKFGVFQCFLASRTQDLDHPFHVTISWTEFNDKGKEIKGTSLCDEKEATLDFQKEFHLPWEKRTDVPLYFNLGRVRGKIPTKVSWLEVRGRVVP